MEFQKPLIGDGWKGLLYRCRILNQDGLPAEEPEEVGVSYGDKAAGVAVGDYDFVSPGHILIHYESHFCGFIA